MTLAIVVDTNVYVGALLGGGGANREVLRRCLGRTYRPLMGAALYAEYEAVSGREALMRRCRLAPREREVLFDAFLAVCQWTHIYYGWRPNLRDEADNHLLELAVAGDAAVIVTHNVRDLRRAELRFPGIRILTPSQLIRET